MGAGQRQNRKRAAAFTLQGRYMFRPGIIEPLHGAKSKTASVRVIYSLTEPVLPLLRRIFPSYIVTTEQIGRCMLEVTRHGAPKHLLESKDISLWRVRALDPIEYGGVLRRVFCKPRSPAVRKNFRPSDALRLRARGWLP